MLTESSLVMTEKQGSWGGAREGAGAKSKWQSEGGTKLVRIPVAIESQVLEAARVIDSGVCVVPANVLLENVTKSSYNENVTESSERIQELESQIEQLQQERNHLQKELEYHQRELNHLGQELAACQASRQLELTDLEAANNRYLASLRLGKQAPDYKSAKKYLEGFIALLRSQ